METLLIVALLLYNGWLVTFLLKERREGNAKGGEAVTTQEAGGNPADIMGKSLFRMDRREGRKDSTLPQAATFPESEAVDERDVTFADVKAGGRNDRPSARIPEDRLDEVFKDTRMEDVTAEYAEGTDNTPEPRADGISFDEIAKAVETVANPEAGHEECREAGKVFHEMDGNGFYDLYMRNHKEYEQRIHGLVNTYLGMPPAPSVKADRKNGRGKNNLQVPDGMEDFDIRNYV